MRPLTVAQAAAGAVVAARLARGRDRPPPIAPRTAAPEPISVVVPARDEERRLGACLAPLLGDPAVAEVIVVDDESGDGTARLAARLGATVVRGAPPPAGWVGKQWALHQGVAAAAGPVVVLLDADTRPVPGLCGGLAALLEIFDLVSAGPRFVTGGASEQALHASFLASLVYRFGPVGPAAPSPHRLLVNGQCMAFRKDSMVEAAGFARCRGHLTDDVALGRLLARDGWKVAFLDAGPLLQVDMHDSVAGVWREWGRSLSLHDVTGPARLAGDLAVVWLTAALPVLRLAAGRATRLDAALLAQRALLAGALRGAYARPGPGLAAAPLLDPLTAVRLAWSVARPPRTWRGRRYGPAPGRGTGDPGGAGRDEGGRDGGEPGEGERAEGGRGESERAEGRRGEGRRGGGEPGEGGRSEGRRGLSGRGLGRRSGVRRGGPPSPPARTAAR